MKQVYIEYVASKADRDAFDKNDILSAIEELKEKLDKKGMKLDKITHVAIRDLEKVSVPV